MNNLILSTYFFIRNGFRQIGFGSFGNNSYIGKVLKVVGKKHIFIGNNCAIYKNARLEALTKWDAQKLDGKIVIGNDVSIEQSCHIVAASELEIEQGCTISANVYISDCGHKYDEPNISVMKQNLNIAPVHIGKNVFIGYGACIMPGTHIGDSCIIGANAVVTKDVPSYSIVAGVPARIIKKYNFETKDWESTRRTR